MLDKLIAAITQPSELEMHRADYAACQAAGFDSPGELLAAYSEMEARILYTSPVVASETFDMSDAVNAAYRTMGAQKGTAEGISFIRGAEWALSKYATHPHKENCVVIAAIAAGKD